MVMFQQIVVDPIRSRCTGFGFHDWPHLIPQWEGLLKTSVLSDFNFHLFVLPFYGLECSTVVGGGSRHGLYRDQSRIGLPLQNNQFYSSNAWFASCMIVHFSAHISKWELVCKFGVIFHTSIISCLCSRFHVWNKCFFYSLITFSYTKCFVP